MQTEFNALVDALRGFYPANESLPNPVRIGHGSNSIYINYTTDLQTVLANMTNTEGHITLRLSSDYFSVRINPVVNNRISPTSSVFVKLPYDTTEESLFQYSTVRDTLFITLDVIQELYELRSVLEARYD